MPMIAANGSGSGGNGQDIRVVFTLDGDVLGEKVIKYHNDQVMVTGQPLKGIGGFANRSFLKSTA